MIQKEYGGYLCLEKGDREYYKNTNEYSVRRYNAARYAIIEAIRDCGAKSVSVPNYMCPSVFDALDKYNIEYVKYSISGDFIVPTENVKSADVIIVTNYFGIFSPIFFDGVIKTFGNVIFDNTQAFFSAPVLKDGVYNVYSPRKFVGVADGAYLITTRFCKAEGNLPEDRSAKRSSFLLNAAEMGTDANYELSLAAEREISSSGIMKMSAVTQYILSNIGYQRTKQIRKENFAEVHSALGEYNELKELCDIALSDDEICPMVYPLLLNSDYNKTREELLRNRIYIPQWWKAVLENNESSAFEKHLSVNLYPLPVDQRYTCDDMQKICGVIHSIIKQS